MQCWTLGLRICVQSPTPRVHRSSQRKHTQIIQNEKRQMSKVTQSCQNTGRSYSLTVWQRKNKHRSCCSTTKTDGVSLLPWLSAWSEAAYGRPKARLWTGFPKWWQQRLLAHIWADREWRWDGKFSYTVLERKREKPGDVSECHRMVCDSGVCHFLFVLQLFC